MSENAPKRIHADDIATAEPGGEWHPKILAFLCNWCSYAGAELAGVSRLRYGPNVRIIRVPYSARVNPSSS